jgi:hypothetical protein
MNRVLAVALAVALGAGLAAHLALAQSSPMQHPPIQGGQPPTPPGPMPMAPGTKHEMHHPRHASGAAGEPLMPGQDAFGAIAEVVRILDTDPATDWSRVDLERLRQHLIDMNEVVLRSQVKQTPVPGGLAMEVTGSGRTEQAIRAMLVPHAAELDRMPSLAARTEVIPGGVRLTVTAKPVDDARAAARLRGLGFAGLLTVGAHHGPHHLAMARGEALVHTH